MVNRSKYVPPPRKQAAPIPASVANGLVTLFSAGQWEQLETTAAAVVQRHPEQALGWQALGKARLKLGKLPEAVAALSQLARLAPGEADAHNDLGSAYNSLGRKGEAEASYRRALKFNPRFAEAQGNLGMVLADLGRFDEATEHIQSSLQLNANRWEPHNNLGRVQREQGRLREAEASYRRALGLNPSYFEAQLNLGHTLGDLGRWDEAQASYLSALEINPNSDVALLSLGSMLCRLGGRDEEAINRVENAIGLNPAAADAYITRATALLHQHRVGESWEMYRRAQQLRPLIIWRARKQTADFSVLLLDTPMAGCTPVDYLVGRAPYDAYFHCLIPDAPQDLELLRAKADVVLNIIADADNGTEILPLAADLVDRLGRPTLNHPRAIMATDRESIARSLAGIPLCRIPKTLRIAGRDLAQASENAVLQGYSRPLLVRLAGEHGGDDFEKFDDLTAIPDFVARRPEANYYVAEYVDYRSADGLFRKYRLINLGGVLLPYHLAIHDDWKVHHFRTDMANQAWMRDEEEAFLKDPQRVFDAAHMAALRAVAAATGLDYCGIDCAVDKNGDIVVFETNAAMRVHDETDDTFAYKNPYIARIKDAFDAMLARLASGGQARIA